MTNPENKELNRRKLDFNFDSKPSIHHKFNFKIAKPYLINKRVLDIGCWSGQFEKLAIKHVKSIVGLDPGEDAIYYAKKNLKGAKFIVGDVLKLPFENNIFDTVIFIEVIEHLPKGKERRALDEISRILKPNGHLVISTPNSSLLSILFDPAFFIIGHRHYSLKQIENLLSASGFKIIRKYKTGGVIRLSTTLVDMLTKHLLGKQITYPAWVKNRVDREYYKGGFANHHIIATKV